MAQKNAIRFYRQEVWAKLQDLAFRYKYTDTQLQLPIVWEDMVANKIKTQLFLFVFTIEVTWLKARWRSCLQLR